MSIKEQPWKDWNEIGRKEQEENKEDMEKNEQSPRVEVTRPKKGSGERKGT